LPGSPIISATDTSRSRSATAGFATRGTTFLTTWCGTSVAKPCMKPRRSSPKAAPTRAGTRTRPGTIIMPISAEGTLRLWQLISPNLPVGAYSYSNGLEQVIETGDVRNEGDVAQWLDEVLSTGLARTDLPVLMRVQRAVAVGDIRTA